MNILVSFTILFILEVCQLFNFMVASQRFIFMTWKLIKTYKNEHKQQY